MFSKGIWFLVVTLFGFNEIKGDSCVPHLHSEIKIVGYEGVLNKEILQLFRGAESLIFIDTNTTGITGNLFPNFPKLKFIHSENNSFYNVDHDNALRGTVQLEELRFINNYWDKPDIRGFSHMPKLRKLFINYCKPQIKDLHPDAFKGTILEVLELKGNGIENVEDLAFNHLEKLEVLNLSGNKIVSIKKEVFLPIKNLKFLDLSNNLIEKFDDTNLPEMTNLEELILTGNPLKNFDKSVIEKLAPKLKTVKI